MIKPHGIIPAMITPFLDDQQVDEEGLRMQTRFLIEQGVHGLFCLGTNGEFFSLNEAEKLKVASIVLEETGGRVPVYAGTGAISTEETIRLTRAMEGIGVDAVSVITPYFLSFSQEELLRHYERLADSTDLPLILYNIPNQTGNALQASTVAKLAKVPNIVGIKDSSGRYDVILQYLDAADDDFAVLAGTDSLILASLMAGGKGAVASTANLIPGILVSIYENWRAGNMDEATKAQNLIRPLRHSFQLGTLPSALKEAMNIAGLPAGPPRSPVAPIGGDQRMRLLEMIEHYRGLGAIPSDSGLPRTKGQ
ncbi:MAG: 4-hydroxy-tetrahydrodipicolinate synthase [Paenibacillus sp.]|nr:4-hydroxy-tetrahydrodipicolinate synthase [Paenibacillus sp.]